VNDFKCWYNVGAKHEQVIPLNTDVDIVDFLNIIEDYESEVVHLYVEHTVDHAIMINETLLLEYSQTQVGEGGGGLDEVHTAGHEHGMVEWMKYIWLSMNTGMVGWMKYKWLTVKTGMELTQMNK
jgi:hypothetical protein